jgi:hypothetical protein
MLLQVLRKWWPQLFSWTWWMNILHFTTTFSCSVCWLSQDVPWSQQVPFSESQSMNRHVPFDHIPWIIVFSFTTLASMFPFTATCHESTYSLLRAHSVAKCSPFYHHVPWLNVYHFTFPSFARALKLFSLCQSYTAISMVSGTCSKLLLIVSWSCHIIC